ncbi:MAG: STAS domain-containing protein, partial [Tannerellaceae bacterium]|nr:STAS domain-containing protein [Tannerellaceae bacterium]
YWYNRFNMEIKVTTGENTVIAVSGQLDTLTAVDFEKVVQEVLKTPVQEVVLETGELTYVSSAGLRLILTLQKGMTARGGSLILKNVQPDVKEIFDITGFSSILTLQ